MDTNAEFPEPLRHQERFAARLRRATEGLEEARRERIRAIVEAYQSGLSVGQIAAATGLSSSRAHQLLGSAEAREILRHRQRLKEPEPPSKRPSKREERAAARALRDLPPSERD